MNNIFIHVAAINNYEKILSELIAKIELDLINYVDNIYVCVSGKSELSFSGKYVLENNGSNISSFEFPTLNKLKRFCAKNPDGNVLYLHTKGVTDPNNECIADWRKCMSYFLIEDFKRCFDVLKDNDTCGVDLKTDPTLHYSGNFWWAKNSHINTLPEFNEMPTILTERHKAEFWVCNKSSNHFSLWESGANQYERHLHRYPEEKYRAK